MATPAGGQHGSLLFFLMISFPLGVWGFAHQGRHCSCSLGRQRPSPTNAGLSPAPLPHVKEVGSITSTSPSSPIVCRPRYLTATTTLHAQKNKRNGVYSRPSAAIERGSGFFVPGLEGAKVRLAGGIILLALTVLNHLSDVTSPGSIYADGVAAVFACLVLLQAAIESTKEKSSSSAAAALRIGNSGTQQKDGDSGNLASRTTLQQVWSMPPIDDSWKARVEWAASSYLALTPATDILLLGPGKVVYSLGQKRSRNKSGLFFGEQEEAATQAALETLSKSSSGRVSLPMTHPTVQAIVVQIPADTGASSRDNSVPRCAILQRVSNDSSQLCWLVLSDQLLASFTKQDLRWLGRLAVYVEP